MVCLGDIQLNTLHNGDYDNNNNNNNLEIAITNISNPAIYRRCFHILVLILCVLTRCDLHYFTLRLHSDAHSNIPMKYYGKSEVMKSAWLLYAKKTAEQLEVSKFYFHHLVT